MSTTTNIAQTKFYSISTTRSRDKAFQIFTAMLPFVIGFCFLPDSAKMDWLWLAFLVQGIFTLLAMRTSFGDRLVHWFAPSSLALAYLLISCTLGACTMQFDIGMGLVGASGRTIWKAVESSATSISIVFLGSLSLMLWSSLKQAERREKVMNSAGLSHATHVTKNVRLKGNDSVLVISILVFAIFSFVPVDLSFLGGAGNFSYPLRLSACLGIFLSVRPYPLLVRLIVYSAIIFFMALQSFFEKREVLYVVILSVFLEVASRDLRIRISLKQTCAAVAVLVLAVVIILWSSIMRGYGQYNPQSALQGLAYIPTYVSEPYFWDAAANNFETNGTLGNSSYCIHLVDEGRIPLQYGRTLLKCLFLPIPRSVFPDKPQSMIDVYTGIAAPALRSRGGSLPVTIPSEMYANFGFIGIVFVPFVFALLDRLFLFAIVGIQSDNSLRLGSQIAIFATVTCFQISRGNGFEVFLIYVIVSIPLMALLSTLGRNSALAKI
jgi:hypothetical protein